MKTTFTRKEIIHSVVQDIRLYLDVASNHRRERKYILLIVGRLHGEAETLHSLEIITMKQHLWLNEVINSMFF